MLRDWILAIPYLQYFGYVFAFFGAFLETLPAVGFFVPGQTVVVLAGFLAQQGILSLTAVFVLASLGAILGDLLGYLLGRKYGTKLFKKQRGIIKDMTDLLHEHPFKTLLFGRFHGLTRAFAPFAAGASGMRLRKFLPANIIGGVLWGGGWVIGGYIFGAGYNLAANSMDKIMLVTGTAVTVMLLVYYYLKKHNVVSKHTRHLLFINIGSLLLFAGILKGVIHGGLATAIDNIVQQHTPIVRWEPLTVFMLALTPFKHLLIISALTIATVLVLWRHNRRETVLFGIAVTGAVLLERGMKLLIMRARPHDALLQLDTFSFPSGHAVISVVFFGALAITMAKYVRRPWLFKSACAAAILVISASRLYIGVHWFSDVLGGLLLGLFWLTFVFLVDEAIRSYSEDKKRTLRGSSVRAVRKKK